ncbi:tfiih and nucleotide excision repair factor 3 complexes subunit [Grosmannia clavigera kw1407]|uniref:RNA polymerase II transcription factor B subunit 2 n=1 Tax=Grosmannia clavigera (strain kw1407 / UAMH 11150) TaxID=655863 RepID=F0XQF4_GROCL|nr:tfiih and nucleotide excision repair factor 3 complexes subunit [Grosmannia clavigera kw1407]EFX00435.1 tfiih and nucleotide excision repair factor 3 complexes subunit [Grosmannia clavigera kw1407]
MASPTGPSLTLSDYLEKQPGTSFRRLYQQPSTTLAIFRRMLPSLAKSFVRMLLYMDGPLLLDTLDTMVVPEAKRERDQALSILRALHIVQITTAMRDRPQEIMLTANFKNSFRLALEGGGSQNSFGVPSEKPVSAETDTAFLDRFARRKWEDILHYVVNSVGLPSGPGHDSQGPKNTVKELLLAGHLVESRPGRPGGVGITQTGFTFLLQAANAQVWTLLLQWLEAVDQQRQAGGAVDSVDMLSFLFMLSTLELGRAYDTNALTEARRNMLPSLMDFGLIYIPPHDRASQYFPTRLATTLTSSGAAALRSLSTGFAAASANSTAAAGLPGTGTGSNNNHVGAASTANSAATTEGRGSVILETNFRLYAYTASPLQIAVLALFSKLSQRFPGMVAGKLTRDSVRRAISYGITSDQIISYLAANAHEQMHKYAAANHRPVLPPTVVDQIRLWELENERMKSHKGFLFKDFDSAKEYDMLAQYADEIGVLVYRNDKKRHFFVTKHEQLVTYLKARKKADQA